MVSCVNRQVQQYSTYNINLKSDYKCYSDKSLSMSTGGFGYSDVTGSYVISSRWNNKAIVLSEGNCRVIDGDDLAHKDGGMLLFDKSMRNQYFMDVRKQKISGSGIRLSVGDFHKFENSKAFFYVTSPFLGDYIVLRSYENNNPLVATYSLYSVLTKKLILSSNNPIWIIDDGNGEWACYYDAIGEGKAKVHLKDLENSKQDVEIILTGIGGYQLSILDVDSKNAKLLCMLIGSKRKHFIPKSYILVSSFEGEILLKKKYKSKYLLGPYFSNKGVR